MPTNVNDPMFDDSRERFRKRGAYSIRLFRAVLERVINHGARCACIGVQYDNIPNSRNVYYSRFPGWTKEARFIAASGIRTKKELD